MKLKRNGSQWATQVRDQRMLQAEVSTNFFRCRAPYCLRPHWTQQLWHLQESSVHLYFLTSWIHIPQALGLSEGTLWLKTKSPEFVSSSSIEFRLSSLFPTCFLFKCVCLIVCGCMRACCVHAMPAEVRRGHQPSPGVEVTGDCEPPCRCWIFCKKTKCSHLLSNLCEPCAQILQTLLSSVNKFLLYMQRDF